LKDGSELAEVTTGGRLFHTRKAATPKLLTGARSQSLECFRLISPVQMCVWCAKLIIMFTCSYRICTRLMIDMSFGTAGAGLEKPRFFYRKVIRFYVFRF